MKRILFSDDAKADIRLIPQPIAMNILTAIHRLAETGATPVTVEEAARSGDVVIVTIPEKNIPGLPRDLFAAAFDGARRVLLRTTNSWPG